MVERDLAKVEVAGSSPVIRLRRVSEKVLAFFVFQNICRKWQSSRRRCCYDKMDIRNSEEGT